PGPALVDLVQIGLDGMEVGPGREKLGLERGVPASELASVIFQVADPGMALPESEPELAAKRLDGAECGDERPIARPGLVSANGRSVRPEAREARRSGRLRPSRRGGPRMLRRPDPRTRLHGEDPQRRAGALARAIRVDPLQSFEELLDRYEETF